MVPQKQYEAQRHELDAVRLIERARAQEGLADFGNDMFRGPLDKLLDCAARDVDFNEQGLEIFKGDIVRCLVNRLRFQHDLARYPEILQEDVSDPFIIIGLGRSGTTKMQKILSAPDDVQKSYFWRIWNPGRVPTDKHPADVSGIDPRLIEVNQAHVLTEDKPGLDAAHHIEQGEVDEEWIMTMLTFDDWCWSNMIPSPSYFDWVMPRLSLETFRYLKSLLQYLQWQDGGKRKRPWVLKGVGYLANLDSLLACFPQATLLHTHRDPRDTIPSYASFEINIWQIQAKPMDPHRVGRETLRMWRTAMDRYLDTRARLKLDDRILDASYEQVRTDPVGIARALYERAGRQLDASAVLKMQGWHEGNEQGKYGKHEYSLAGFGLSERDIDEAFADYIARFIKR